MPIEYDKFDGCYEARKAYEAFQVKAGKAEAETGFYLTDMCIDRENNVDENDAYYTEDDGTVFWVGLLRHGESAFGARCEENDIDAYDYGIAY